MSKFSYTTKEELRYYVYLLKNPKSGKIFYVGKGKGDRVFAHAKAAIKDRNKQNFKLDVIRGLMKLGLRPSYEILRHGMSEKEAFEVEAAIIDLERLEDLRGNLVAGRDKSRGKMSISQIKILYEPKIAPIIIEKVILININKNFQPDKNWDFYYRAVKGRWILKKERAEKAEYVFAVYQGVVYAIVKITPGSWNIEERRSGEKFKKKQKGLAFLGKQANKILEDKYLHKFVGKHNQNPIRYINIEE